jgi:pimeloyl-ACP methyl ester carboxylesterase
MAFFVLIHGSGQNSSCWQRVAGILESPGHQTLAPDLPKRLPEWRLRDYAAEIAKHVDRPDAVLVAHSFTGVLLPLIHEMRPACLLVFLAALIPEPGKSVVQQIRDDPSMFSPAWLKAGPRWLDPSQHRELAEEFLFHDCDDEALSWGLTTVDLFHIQQLVAEPNPMKGWPDVPAAYIIATHDRTLAPDWSRRMSRKLLKIEPMEFASGHCPHVSQPEHVADTLASLAERCMNL